ncbi:hypothetical protein Trydic_g22367 [Trypoxylus dichotomus]
MGSALSCNKCPAASTASVFTFSEPLVLKLTEGIQPEPEKRKDEESADIQDREWMDKIKCIEDVHTNAYGLSKEGFERIFHHVERTLTDMEEKDVCLERVKECYKKYPGETLRCESACKEFYDRVDLQRLKTIKKKFTSNQT